MSPQDQTAASVAEVAWLEQIHQRWVATLDAIRDAILVVDSGATIVRGNRAFAQLVGCSITELIPSPLAEALPWAMDTDGKLACGTVVCRDDRYFRIRLLSDGKPHAEAVYVIEDVSSQYLLGVAEEIRQQDSARSLYDTIHVLSNALLAKDPYTVSHNKRVAALAKRVALRLDCSDIEAQGIYYGALVHDIGKLSIPSGLLSKPGRLAQVEFNLMKTHCEAGYAIVKDMEFPWPVHEIVLQHHERINGSGYPNGLSGEAIHPAAKIVAVADVVEAMTSHRPYRAALGVQAALSEIQAGRGCLYAAEVVDACCNVVENSNGDDWSLANEG